jgi:hypothetical protein
MKIQKLIIKNFKGIDDLEINFDGKNAVISGDNATLKTTIADSLYWVLEGKNSIGQSEFEIKPKNHTSDFLNILETSVEIISDTITLKKIFKEKWTAVAKNPEKKLTGHITEYWIDKKNISEREWNDKLEELSGDKMQFLINPLKFMEKNASLKKGGKVKPMTIEDRRQQLFDIFGNKTDIQIIEENPQFSELLKINNMTYADKKKALKNECTNIQKEIEIIPVQIAERKKINKENSVDISKIEAAKKNIIVLKADLKKLESEKTEIENNAGLEFKKQISELELQQLEIKNKIISENNNKIQSAKNEKADLQIKIKMLTNSIIELNKQHSDNISKIEIFEEERQTCIKKWNSEKKSKYIITDFQENNQCPLLKVDCEKLKESAESAKKEYLKNEEKKQSAFNLEKAKNILGIENHGTGLKNAIYKLKADNKLIQAELETKKAELKQTADAEKTIVVSPEIDYNTNAEYIELVSKIDELKNQAENSKPDTTETETLIKIKETEIEELQSILNKEEIYNNNLTEINNYNNQLIKKREEFQDSQNLINLLDSFFEFKSKLLSEPINEKFKICKWKLFELQINGGLNETCECMINTNGEWVEWWSANNNGRINAGIEIINLIAEYVKFKPPIIIDNAEGSSRLIETQSQLILFEKPPAFKQLRAEIKKMLIENENGNTKKAEEKYNKSIEKLNVELF